MGKTIANTIVCIFILMLVISCSGEADRLAQNKELVHKVNDVLNAHDIEKMREFYAEDFVRHCQATPEMETSDLDAFIKLSNDWMTATPDAKQTIHFLAAEGDLVAFYTTFEGTHTGQMGPFPSTGKKMSAECFGFHRIENGKIAETWVTWDNLTTLMQLGLFPPPQVEEAE